MLKVGGVTMYIAKNNYGDFKQVFSIAVAIMSYLHAANTFRGIQVLLTVKTCEGFTSLFPLPWKQAQAYFKMKIEWITWLTIPLENA